MPSLIERIKQRMNTPGGVFAVPPPAQKKSRRLIANANRFDDLAYKTARSTDKMGAIVHDLSIGAPEDDRPELETAPELVEGLFHAAYKAAPRLEGKRSLERELYPVRQILKEVIDHPRLKELHDFTEGDTSMSVVAVDAMQPIIKEILTRVSEQTPPPQPTPPNPNQPPGGGGQNYAQGGGGSQGQGQGQPQQGQGGGGQGQNPQQGGQGQQGQGGGPGGQPQGQQPQQQGGGQGGGQPDPNQPQGQGGGNQPGQQDPNAPQGGGGAGQDEGAGNEDPNGTIPPEPEEKDAEEGDGSEYEQDLTGDWEQEFNSEPDYDQAEADWERAWDDILADLDVERHVNKAIEAAQREASELDNLRKGIGLDDGVWALMSPEERLAFAEQMRTPEMQMLASIIGRMKRFALGVKATRVVDVNHEAFNVELGNDIRRVLRHQLVLLAHPDTRLEFYRRYADKELLQYKMRGHEDVGKGPIVMCIDKSGSMNGQPFQWALAVAEALRRFAAEEDRDMEVIFFGSNSDRVRFSFPKGHAPFEKIMAFLGAIANGGTQFDGVLEEALDKATNAFDGEGKGKADIVFLTDGQAALSEQWIEDFNKERERVGVRVYSVYIGGAQDMTYQTGPLGLLEKISDACIPVSELKPEAAQEIFAKV